MVCNTIPNKTYTLWEIPVNLKQLKIIKTMLQGRVHSGSPGNNPGLGI